MSSDIVKHLSSRSSDTFRSLSEKWHQFLRLSSYGGKGQKRDIGMIDSIEKSQNQCRMMGTNIV